MMKMMTLTNASSVFELMCHEAANRTVIMCYRVFMDYICLEILCSTFTVIYMYL